MTTNSVVSGTHHEAPPLPQLATAVVREPLRRMPGTGGAGPLGIAALAIAGTAVGLAFGAMLVAIVATRLFGFEMLTVRSSSMEPAISRGDLIVVRPTAMANVTEGDVVLFAAGGDGIPTVHRVAGINEVELRIRDAATGETDIQTSYRLVTKGDANEQPDIQEVTESQLRGEVWFTVPGAGELTGLPLQWLLLGFAGLSLAAWAAWETRAWRNRT
jgi:signal peptidase I